jgi:putative DNA primase/helicase
MTDEHDNDGEEGGDVTNAHTITEKHMALLTSSAITPDVAFSAGVFSVTNAEDVPEVFREWPGRGSIPGLVFPWRGLTDEVLQLRPDRPVKRGDGSEAKYVFPKGVELVLSVHPLMEALVRDPEVPLVITEGTKQTLAAVSALVGGQDYAVVGIAGCYGWSQRQQQIPDLHELAHALRGRTVYTVFDADWTTNRGVWQAAKGLTDQLKLHGAATVRYVTVPGGRTTGLDDALASTIDPATAIRGLLDSATKTLGRPPRKSQASTYFDEDGSLLTEKAVEGLLADTPAALAMDGTVAIYSDGRYVIDHHQQALYAAVGELLGDKYRPSYRAAVHEFMQGRLHSDRRRLHDRPRSRWLNLLNGMLDLDSLELHPHDPEHLSTVQLPVAWDPEAQCPTYERWIDQVAGDEQLELLEATTSQMLDPGITPSKSLFLFGPSRSGKSTYLRIMRAIMGEENTSSVTLHQLSDDRFASANLYGKALNVAADLSSAHVQDLSTWKMLTGEDPVQANRKHGAQFSFVNYALFAFSANEPPTVGESSRAYFARIVPVKFGASFEGAEDPSLEAQIMHAELPGVLRRWVAARNRWRSTGRFPLATSAIVAEFEAASDRVALWLGENKTVVTEVPGPEGGSLAVSADQILPTTFGTTLTDLHSDFQEWAKANGYASLGRNKFGDRLSRHDGVLKIRIGKGSKNQRALNVIDKPDDEDRPVGSVGTFQPTTGIAGTEENRANRTPEDTPGYGDSASKSANTANYSERSSEAEDHAESPTPAVPGVVTADVDDLTVWVFDNIAANPTTATEGKVRSALRISQTEFHAARDWLIANGVIAKRRSRGFDVLADLVQAPAPYTPMTDPHFVNRPGAPVSLRSLLAVDPRPCPECGAPTDDPSSYFPFCRTHRLEVA